MLRATVAAESFVGKFRHVRTSHYNRHARSANSICDAIGLGNHPRHSADTHQADSLLFNEPHQILIVHWLGVPVDQQYLVFRRRQRFEQKHPQVRHEIPRHTIIRVVQKYFHVSD